MIEITDWHDSTAVRDGVDGEYTLGVNLDAETPGYCEHDAGSVVVAFHPSVETARWDSPGAVTL